MSFLLVFLYYSTCLSQPSYSSTLRIDRFPALSIPRDMPKPHSWGGPPWNRRMFSGLISPCPIPCLCTCRTPEAICSRHLRRQPNTHPCKHAHTPVFNKKEARLCGSSSHRHRVLDDLAAGWAKLFTLFFHTHTPLSIVGGRLNLAWGLTHCWLSRAQGKLILPA